MTSNSETISQLRAWAALASLATVVACGSDGGSSDDDADGSGDTSAGDVTDDAEPGDADDSGDSTDAVVDADGGGDADSGDAGDTGDAADADADVDLEHCGDGVLDDGEACDDGNEVNDDRCDNDCAYNVAAWCAGCDDTLTCGGATESCEETGHGAICTVPCDDASAACPPDFACEEIVAGTFVCLPDPGVCFSCGDGVTDGTDACDDGNDIDGDGCSRLCALEEGFACLGAPSSCNAICGDGLIIGGEECDDDDDDSGDGCSDACTVEPGWLCDGVAGVDGTASLCAPVCGDSMIVGDEACDDGSDTPGDGCSELCAVETGWTCVGDLSVCSTDCGDGVIAGSEICDDNNEANGDGCSDACVVESGWSCEGDLSVCTTDCSDGIIAGAEQCDDGGEFSGDGCSDACLVEAGWSCDGDPSVCVTSCGDGVIAGTEACDDFNGFDGDGCSDECFVEAGWTCEGDVSVCVTDCGDGIIAGNEICDDGGDAPGDGCSDLCEVELGWTCVGETSLCDTRCGDGIIAGTEVCDDSNDAPGDGCSDLCEVERGFDCAGVPSVCATECGDEIIGGFEGCDDGDDAAGDGCSDLCEVESGWGCTLEPSECVTDCGDGILAGAEVCDDANEVNDDGCTNACVPARCGDGIVQSVLGEECDDSNGTDGDSCRPGCFAYRSCAHARERGATTNGIFWVKADAAATPQEAYCDQTTDNGGWTLVGSTRSLMLDDAASAWYADLKTLAPASSHTGIWNGLRPLAERFDVRVACRASVGAATDPFTVDLSFYDVPWYTEWTTGTDANSCFSENNGLGADSRVPARRDNIGDRFRRADDVYDVVGFLEGEDSCDATDDFAIDFDSRGMDSTGTNTAEWGEDDRALQCGTTTGLATGQWFVMVRERPRVAVVGLPQTAADAIRTGGFLADVLPYDAALPARLTVENYDTIVIGRYSESWTRMTQALREALHIFARSGGNIVSEWDGASIFMSTYDSSYRNISGAAPQLGLYTGSVGGGLSRGSGTAITQTVPTDPLFSGVSNPFSSGGATEFFFWLGGATQLQTVATFPGGAGSFPNATYGAIYRGRYCGGNGIFTTFDWSDNPAAPGFGSLITNLVREASEPPPAYLTEACQDARRSSVTMCGTSQRALTDFGITLPVNAVGSGLCTANDTVQAVFIMRNGVSNLDVAGLRSYVQNGGIVITEFTSSDEVYNAIFAPGTAVTQGVRVGGCGDNIMPAVQRYPSDSLWQDNRFSATSAGVVGCGHDLSAFPSITALGGVDADSVTLAYRDLGAGRVWFVESDWQDTQVTMSDASRGLMRHMYRHRARGALDRGATFAGVRTGQNIHDYIDTGFQPCLQTGYNSTVSLAEISDACTGDVLMMACRQAGSPTLTVSAIGRRAEVFEDVGAGVTAVNLHNGTNWYNSADRSWGFAPSGQTVNRNSCDTLTALGDQRLCWHTSSNNLSAGWRCGSTTGLNGADWERVILQRGGDLPPL